METLMPLITEQELKNKKKSNTIIIYGCGSSYNNIEDWQLREFNEYDSISFNWFCFSYHPTTYYLVREQANLKKRIHGEENLDNFYHMINDKYKNSSLIIHDLDNHSPHVYSYAKNAELFDGDYVVIRDTKLKNNDPGVKLWGKKSIFEQGIIHGKCTLTNAIHFAVWMKYKKIIFIGVDLYDSKYFWLDNKETRYAVKDKNKKNTSKHSTANYVLGMIKKVRKVYPKIKMYTCNEKSLLREVMGIW